MTSYLSKIKSLGLKEKNLASENFSSIIEYASLKRGMGLTIGNALRRVLLSSVPGYAMRSVTISGVQHEFSSIPGVKEDTQQLIMNLKKIVFKGEISKTKATINIMGPCTVTGANVACSNIEVVNQDLYICSLDQGFNLKLEMNIEKGIGIKMVNDNKSYEVEVGSIACDSFFSPIENVNFEVAEHENEGETLKLHIVTNGSITPEAAFQIALNLIMEQFGKRVFIDENAPILPVTTKRMDILSPNLFLKIEELPDISTRTLRCLKMLGIVYVGDLVKLSKAALMREPNFGENSLNKLLEKLSVMGLTLDMNIPGWPPENLASKAEDIGNRSIL